jgi:threonine dehydrogenase-like Zn-dependent dehydrogenase
MKAITITPGKPHSARVQDVPEPPESDGEVLVRALALGICGTDFELVSAEYGWPPPGSDYLILGHESLGIVEDAPQHTGFEKGDLVVGIVRRPDPVPCVACAINEWDMCRNGKYTERGIKSRNGFGSERFRNEANFTVKLDPSLSDVGVLMEPASILAKAWEHVEAIGRRAAWKPKCVLVTGAGPIGMLAALMGKQRGLEVHVLDQVKDGLKPELVHQLGAEYHTGKVEDIRFTPDVILECTGVQPVITGSMQKICCDGILCLVGVSAHHQEADLDIGELNRRMVLNNGVIFGTVNANRHHYDLAQKSLLEGDRSWLSRLITRRESLAGWENALQRKPGDIKVILDFTKN